MKKLFNLIIIPLITFSLFSCSGVRMAKSSLNQEIDSLDIYISNSGTYRKSEKDTTSFLSLFNIYDQGIDSVHIQLSDTVIIISAKSKFYVNESVFKYKYEISKKGYIEIFLKNTNVVIPPILPVYVNVDVDRKRLILTTDGKLLVDNKVRKGRGVILYNIKGSRTQYLFDTLKH